MNSLTVGVILSGSGVYDGTEIHEATLTLLALDQLDVNIELISVNKPQHHVIDHSNQSELTGDIRNVLTESARISRGPVTNINDVTIESFDAFIFPGGFGVAKNLCTFAVDGASHTIDSSISTLVKTAHQHKIPMGFLCISPVIPAAIIPNVKLTIGTDTDTANAIVAMGAEHVNSTVNDVVIDDEHLIASTPAYMLATRISELTIGINALVNQVFSWANERNLAHSSVK